MLTKPARDRTSNARRLRSRTPSLRVTLTIGSIRGPIVVDLTRCKNALWTHAYGIRVTIGHEFSSTVFNRAEREICSRRDDSFRQKERLSLLRGQLVVLVAGGGVDAARSAIVLEHLERDLAAAALERFRFEPLEQVRGDAAAAKCRRHG